MSRAAAEKTRTHQETLDTIVARLDSKQQMIFDFVGMLVSAIKGARTVYLENHCSVFDRTFSIVFRMGNNPELSGDLESSKAF